MGDHLNRREVLKLLSASSTPFFLPPALLAAFRDVHAALPAARSLKALDAHQDATVTAMADRIIPATETPGAKAVRVNEFVDLIVADWLLEEERARFLAGLADVDARTQEFFQKDFIDASSEQQSAILRLLGADMAAQAIALANGPRGYRGSLPEPEDSFYFMLRQLVLVGYFTSEAGFTQQLHEEIIPGRFDGCVPASPPATAKTT
jgi:glucoside 3-dehydrogenase (cytochrome c) hitch-hiker subunit